MNIHYLCISLLIGLISVFGLPSSQLPGSRAASLDTSSNCSATDVKHKLRHANMTTTKASCDGQPKSMNMTTEYGPYGKYSVAYMFSDKPGAKEWRDAFAKFTNKRLLCPFEARHAVPPNFNDLVPPVEVTEGCCQCQCQPPMEPCQECVVHLLKRHHDEELIKVKTHIHVACDPGQKKECVDRAQIQRQMDVVNQIYRPVGFYFDWKWSNPIMNADWFAGNTLNEDENADRFTPIVCDMVRKLHKGGAADLNVYIRGPNIQDVSALTITFPHELNTTIQKNPKDDGIIIDFRMLAAEKPYADFYQRYIQGFTLVHEIGHWLGLFHTFEGSCEGSDIYYKIPDDTPAEMKEADMDLVEGKCPVRDTCPDKPGMDPVNNYMNYLPDQCLTKFTDSQIRQMRHAYKIWRLGQHNMTASQIQRYQASINVSSV